MKKPSDDSLDFSDLFLASPTSVYGGGPDHGPNPGPNPGPATGSPIVVPQETLEAEAAVAASGPGGAGSTVAVGSSAGLTINLMFDAAAMAAPQSFRDGITQAMQMICAVVTDKITLNIQIDYSGTGGSAAAGPSGGYYEPYSTVRADLVNNASPGDTTFNALPTGSSIAGQTQVAVWYSQAKLWGIVSPTGTEVDGSATFSTDINPNLLVGVAMHELTHAMGRVPYGPPSGSQPDIFDFFRFTSSGNILINGASTAQAAYFSLDGGNTKLADYGQTSDPSDFLNSGVQGSTDPFNEFYSNSTQQQLTAIDLVQLDALGFHLSPSLTVQIENVGSTSLVQLANSFFLDSVATGVGPELKYSGAPVTSGQFGNWTPIGVEQTASGYEVAWKIPGNDQYEVWLTDATGTYQSNSGVLSGTSTTLEQYELSFHQDLNGDNTIGFAGTVVEAFGSTELLQTSGNNFEMLTGSNAVELMYGGAPVTVGQFGAWTAIGAEQTATGYEVAWKIPGSSQFIVWFTDANGNYTSNTGTLSGTSTTLEQLETSFHQDLNGDNTIGVPTTTIEAKGATSLVQQGNNFFLDSIASGTGPELNYNGSPVTVGEFGSWTPIGAEQTASGYEVAWKIPGSDQYEVWLTDANGNYQSNSGVLSGTSATLEQYETSFHQDLNGDNTIGIAGTTIEAQGSTSLVQVGNNFFLLTGGTGPELNYGGSPVTVGQFGNWTPIGAEQTASGYEVAWKMPGSSQFIVWFTDANGNYQSNTGTLSGTSTTLEQYEVGLHQDLNGDNTIGIPGTTIEALGSTILTQTGGNNFYMTNTDGTGVELSYSGAPVTAGQFGAWTPIGAEKTASGYEVAWKVPGSSQFIVWLTDANGNYQSNSGTLSGTSTTLEQYETSFHQDLNGDGVIGVPAHQSPASGQPAGAIAAVSGDSFVFPTPPTVTAGAGELQSLLSSIGLLDHAQTAALSSAITSLEHDLSVFHDAIASASADLAALLHADNFLIR